MTPGQAPVRMDERTLLDQHNDFMGSLEHVIPGELMPPYHWDLWACDKIEPIEEHL
jgi:hypothetical protein